MYQKNKGHIIQEIDFKICSHIIFLSGSCGLKL